jgi:hypothetical protein
MYARYNKKKSQEEYMGKKHIQSGRYSGTCEKAEVVMGWTQREEWMADGREKYLNGIREDVKESKVDRVDDGLMN